MLCFYTQTGDRCFITGWGNLNDEKDKPNILQTASVRIVSTAYCEEAYGIRISDSMLCAGSHYRVVGACHGDSGGIKRNNILNLFTINL